MADSEKSRPNGATKPNASESANDEIVVVGVGASAGGYEAIEKFFAPMPEDAGVAFVVVQHLSPDYKSLMVELLAKRTKLKPVRIEDGMTVQPNHIYLVPPKKDVTLEGDELRVREATYRGGVHLPIDAFFRSLAKARKERAIAVVLSGAGADGTLGVRDVKGYGGLTMAQDPLDAKFDSMPRSAVATGLVDFVLAPEVMPKRLFAYLKREPIADEGADYLQANESSVARVVEALRKKADLDFSQYKPTTVIRRLERRIGVLQCRSVEDYVRKIEASEKEAKTLAKELLIGVTKFFREPEAFEFLKREIVPKIVEKKEGEPLRVWAVGCSTGEEAYSLAMAFAEYLDEIGSALEVKIFATDIDDDALERAGVGLYPDTIVSEMSQERVERFFSREGTNYRVSERIRRMAVFARHNAIVDPPFSRLDLVVCRNLLIYFLPSAQKRALSYFHFALRENGYLFLGKSETVGDLINQFKSVGGDQKVYKKIGSEDSALFGRDALTMMRRDARRGESDALSRRGGARSLRVDREYRSLMEPFEPSAILLDERDEPTYVFGEAGRFLAIGKGEPNLNAYRMMPDNLAAATRSAVRGAREERKRVVCEGMVVTTSNGKERVDVVASLAYPDADADRSVFVVFDTARRKESDDVEEEVIDMDAVAKRRIKDLERELELAKGNLQATVEELETSNEELQATNEELLASNEELQSSNEEMQSVNEELITVNSEYQKKIDELTRLTSDYDNLLDVADVGTLFLDEALRVRKFTPRLREELGMRDADVGRPIDHFSLAFFYEEFLDNLRDAALNGTRTEREVVTANGVYQITVQPYIDSFGERDGALVTLADTTRQREMFDRIKLLAETLERSPSVVVLADPNPAITYVNEKFTEVTGYTLEEVRGKNPNVLASRKMPPEEARKMWRNLVIGKSWETNFSNRRKNGELYHERATILPLKNKAGEIAHYAKVAEDVTEQVELREKLHVAREEYDHLEAASGAGETPGTWARYVGVWEEDFKRRRTEWSAACYRMFGVKRSAFSPARKTIMPLVAKEDRKALEGALKEAKKTGASIDVAFGLANGKRTLRLKASVAKIGGRPARLAGVLFDVSDEAKRLARAEKTIAELERRLASLDKK
ncbi:MAG: PAS domain S-box protein [Ignavibacteriales bacterium]|nr:PAS domain S-box protein [Ignavibacteriales bacterium]